MKFPCQRCDVQREGARTPGVIQLKVNTVFQPPASSVILVKMNIYSVGQGQGKHTHRISHAGLGSGRCEMCEVGGGGGGGGERARSDGNNRQ